METIIVPFICSYVVVSYRSFNWLRYRVRFANGTEVGDLDHRNIAPIGKTARRLERAAKRAL